MLKDHIPFAWNDEGKQEETFIMVKQMLLDEDNLLICPDFAKKFILQTDASTLGLGAVLCQMVEGKERPIAYASKRTSHTEVTYGSLQLEILAVCWAIKHFKHYLAGTPFILVADHAPLKQLITLKDPKGVIARYIM